MDPVHCPELILGLTSISTRPWSVVRCPLSVAVDRQFVLGRLTTDDGQKKCQFMNLCGQPVILLLKIPHSLRNDFFGRLEFLFGINALEFFWIGTDDRLHFPASFDRQLY